VPKTGDFDPRDLIEGPFISCPKCLGNNFGILSVGPSSFDRLCRDCLHDETFGLPVVRKVVIYLDQFVISNLMLVRSKSPKQVEPFYGTLYNKLSNLSKLQAIICPYSDDRFR